MNPHLTLLRAATAILKADTLLITAGAGMGVDSGLPDFRGPQGFWKVYPQYAAERLSFSDLANPMWFKTDPAKAWGFYGYRYQLYQQTLPHAGFALLKRWQESRPEPGFVVTTNVDGHFQKAGFSSQHLYECHGAIHALQCTVPCTDEIWTDPTLKFDIEPQQMRAIGRLPTCPYCGAIARPNVLMFNDGEWLSHHSDQQRQRFNTWKKRMVYKRKVIIELGAGSTLGGVRSIGNYLPGTLIRINPDEAQGPQGTLSLAMGALEALQAIEAIIQNN